MNEKYYSNISYTKLKNFLIIKNFIPFKVIYFIILLIIFKIYKINLFNKDINRNYYYSYTKYKIYNRIKKKKSLKNIKFGIYIDSLSNGGRERITALLINYLSNKKLFDIFLFTRTNKNIHDYKIHINVKRIRISSFEGLKKKLLQNNIEVFVYQSYNIYEIEMLNKLNKVKTIFYNHSSFLFWIYFNRIFLIKRLYNSYKKSKYIIFNSL